MRVYVHTPICMRTSRMRARPGWVSCLVCMGGWMGWMDGCSFVSFCVCVHNLVCGLVLVDIEPQALVEQLRYIAPRVLHFSAFNYYYY